MNWGNWPTIPLGWGRKLFLEKKPCYKPQLSTRTNLRPRTPRRKHRSNRNQLASRSGNSELTGKSRKTINLSDVPGFMLEAFPRDITQGISNDVTGNGVPHNPLVTTLIKRGPVTWKWKWKRIQKRTLFQDVERLGIGIYHVPTILEIRQS